MKHFYEEIDGWFNFHKVYSDAVKNAKDEQHFVEVGAYKGKSTAFLAVEIIKSGKDIQLDVVDLWKNRHSEDEWVKGLSGVKQKDWQKELAKVENKFFENMKPVIDHINVIKMDSAEAAKLYQNRSLDFVFIDACHCFECTNKDILAWKSKVRGTMSGHDYDWDGVYKAVNENFSNIEEKEGKCWESKQIKEIKLL